MRVLVTLNQVAPSEDECLLSTCCFYNDAAKLWRFCQLSETMSLSQLECSCHFSLQTLFNVGLIKIFVDVLVRNVRNVSVGNVGDVVENVWKLNPLIKRMGSNGRPMNWQKSADHRADVQG